MLGSLAQLGICMTPTATHSLRRILGLGFGLAMVFGTMVGVGILRLPGTVAAALGDRSLIIVFWVVGGIYALLGAAAVSELAAMMPEAGGFRVYARRAFGEGCGFAIGWCDWLSNAGILAYVSMTAVTFLGVLWPAAAMHSRAVAIALVVLFTTLHWAGVRIASTFTRLISVAIGLMLMILVIACFLGTPVVADGGRPFSVVGPQPLLSIGMLIPIVTALRAILLSYGGWYSPIYMAEENTNPAQTLPRAIIGGALLVSLLYVTINLALLHVLPLSVLSASTLPAADAARIVLPRGGAELVTVLSLFTVLSLLNNVMLMGPRVLFAIGRDGFFTAKAALVSDSGTPRVALLVTSAAAAAFILSGTFEQTIALCAVLFLVYYVAAFLAVFVLRAREPDRERPYRAFGHPVSTGIVLAGSVAMLVAAVIEDRRSGLIAALVMVACIPVYAWLARERRRRGAAFAV